jgi:hypothetical protein
MCAMPLFGYSVAPEQNIFLFAATSHNSAQQHLLHTQRRGIIIFFSPQALQHLLVNNFAAPTDNYIYVHLYIDV